jgi:hypothetical protein
MGRDIVVEWAKHITFFQPKPVRDYDEVLKPFRFVFGGENPYLLPNNALNKPFNDGFTAFIKPALLGAEFLYIEAADAESLFSGDFILCEYRFAMPSREFGLAVTRNNTPLNLRIDSFDAVLITFNGYTEIRFINYGENQTALFRVNENIQPLIALALNAERIPVGYMSFANLPPVFGERTRDMGFGTVTAVLPFANESGELLRHHIQSKIGFLFDNPGRIISDFIDEYRFNEGNVTVKYNTNNVMEYSYHGLLPKRGNTFFDAFDAAVAFLRADETVDNEWFWSGFDSAGDEWRFYFDFIVGNHPVILMDVQQSILEMRSMIEITVVNGTVINYRRLVCNFLPNAEIAVASNDITDAYEMTGGIFDGTNPIAAQVGYAISMYFFSLDFDAEIKPMWFFVDSFTVQDENGAESSILIPSTGHMGWR